MKSLTLLLSHLALGLAGWGIVAAFWPASTQRTPVLPGKSDIFKVRGARAPGLVAGLRAKIAEPDPPVLFTDAENLALQQRIDQRLLTFAVPADFEKAVEEAKARGGDPVELGTLLLAWGRLDLDAAARHLDTLPDGPLVAILTAVGERLGREADPEVVLAIESHHFDHEEPFLIGLARQLAASCSHDDVLAYVRKTNDVSALSEFSHALPLAWPLDRGTDLIAIAIELDEPGFLGTLCARLPSGQRVKWLHEALDSGLDPDFVHSAVDGAGDANDVVFSEASASLDERLAILMRGDYEDVVSRERSAAFNRERLMKYDLEAFLEPKGQPDLIQDFRTGMIEASSLFEGFKKAHRDYEDREIRRELLEVLWSSDPRRAVALLDSLPENDRDLMLFGVLFSESETVHPDLLREAGSLLADRDGSESLPLRKRIWSNASYRYREYFGTGYTEWIAALPPGLDRDLAYAGLADSIADDFPDEAAGLRQQIADPRLK